MKTYSMKKEEIRKEWYIADAAGRTLGRLASRIAQILKGKHKPGYSPHMDMGDFVIVVNAEKIRVSGTKEINKAYFSHSGYPGGTKVLRLHTVRDSQPEKIVSLAVKGMLPKNSLGRAMFRHLKVYNGPDHPHTAQKPKELEF